MAVLTLSYACRHSRRVLSSSHAAYSSSLSFTRRRGLHSSRTKTRINRTNVGDKNHASANTNSINAPMMKMKIMGMSPAWKRHLIRQRRNDLCNKNSMQHKICTKNNATTTYTDSKDDGTSLLSPSTLMTQIKSFSIGSIAGLMGSLAGMGGGFVMIPLMTAARRQASSKGILLSSWRGGLGLQQHQAHGTSLFAVGTTGLAGALGYGITMSGGDDDDKHDKVLLDDEDKEIRTKQTFNEQQKAKKGLVQLDTALALATTAMFTARFGAIASSHLSERMLQRALGAFMICVAPLVPGKAYLEKFHGNTRDSFIREQTEDDVTTMKHLHDGDKSQLERLLPASLIGLFSGFLAGMFGVGGGTIVVPALVLSTDMPYHSALGTSLCAMVLPAVVGCYTHSLKGNVNWRVAPMLAFGSAVGSFFGGREVGLNMDEGSLTIGFSCLMFVLGVKTWRKGSGR